jgi:hypothetical protein
MDNLSIEIQDSQNPIVTQINTEFNSLQDNQPVFIHKLNPDNTVQIIDLNEWSNQYGTFKSSLENSGTYDPNENIYYAYNGNSNHVEILRMSEIGDYTLPTIIFLESSKYYYNVKVAFEYKTGDHNIPVDLEIRNLTNIITNPEDYQGEIYLNRFPEPSEFRSILIQLRDYVSEQFTQDNSDIGSFVNSYIKIFYEIFKVGEDNFGDQLIKTLETSLILIPPLDTLGDSSQTKIYGIELGYNDNSVSNDNDVKCLKRTSKVNIINGSYTLNGETDKNNTVYGINSGQYRLTDIPINHPMRIINKDFPLVSYIVDNANPITIDVTRRLDPGNFPPGTIDNLYKFNVNGQPIYMSNSNPEVQIYRFMRNRTYIFKKQFVENDNMYFYISLNSNFQILTDSSSIYIQIPTDFNNNTDDKFSSGFVTSDTYSENMEVNSQTNLSLLIKNIDGINYDYYYGDILMDISYFEEPVVLKMSIECFYHGSMGGDGLLVFDKNCSQLKYNIVDYRRTEKVYFDISNRPNQLGNDGMPIYQTVVNGSDYKGYHSVYNKTSVLSNDIQLISGYNYLFLDLNFRIEYTPMGNIIMGGENLFPYKLLLNNSLEQQIPSQSNVENQNPFSGISSLNIDFLNNNFNNFFTSVKVDEYNQFTYNTRIPKILKSEQYNQHPNSHNFVFFKFNPSNTISYLHLFNANIEAPYDQLLEYKGLADYNPIYRSNATYLYTIQSLNTNSITINFDNIDEYLSEESGEYLFINKTKLVELGLQVVVNDNIGDIVVPNPTLKIHVAYYTNEDDEIIKFPSNLDIINLVKNNNYLNLRLSLSYEDDNGNISIFPTNISNLALFYRFVNSSHIPENDDPGLTFLFEPNNITYPIDETVNHHNMFESGFIYPNGTGSYSNINVLDIGDIELLSSHNQQPIYSSVKLDMTSITYYNGLNINKLPISEQTYEIINDINDTENIHVSIKLDSIYKYSLKELKMYVVIRGNPQYDVYGNVILSSNFLNNDVPILDNTQLISLEDTGMEFLYKTIPLTLSDEIGYFDNITLKVKINTDTEPNAIDSLGLLNHLFLTFTNEPNKLLGISADIYSSYNVYKNLIPKPTLNKFTYYLDNELSVPINVLQNKNDTIIIDNNSYNNYKIALVDDACIINNFTQEDTPILLLRKSQNVSNILFNGNELSFSNSKNDVVDIGNGLSLIVLSNDDSLMVVKIADMIDLITDVSSFFSTLMPIEDITSDTLDRGYNALNDIYNELANSLGECIPPIHITNSDEIQFLISNARVFLKNPVEIKNIYIIPVLQSPNFICFNDIKPLIKSDTLVMFTSTINNPEVLVKLESIDYTFREYKDNFIINNRELFLGEKTVINKIQFEYIGLGSRYLLLRNDIAIISATGVGGDPYICNLQGLKYKIPPSNNYYCYIDNRAENEHNRFIINFETYILEGEELNHLNNYIVNKIAKINDLKSKASVAEWLFKNNLQLDMNACFIKRFFIKNGKHEFIFDLNEFRIYDIYNNELHYFPSRFNPIKNNSFKMNDDISEHIGLKDEKPIYGLKLETNTQTFGTVFIEFMKYSHPQIRNNINITFEKNPINTDSVGGIVKNRHYILPNINSNTDLVEPKLIENATTEIYLNNVGKLKKQLIKE